jgi:hypothetical protein
MAALAEHGLLEDLASASLHVPRNRVDANSLPAHLVKQVGIRVLFAIAGTDVHLILNSEVER